MDVTIARAVQGPAFVVNAMILRILHNIRTSSERFGLKHSVIILLLQQSFGCTTNTRRGDVVNLVCADWEEKELHNSNTRKDRGVLNAFKLELKGGARLPELLKTLESVCTPMHLASA